MANWTYMRTEPGLWTVGWHNSESWEPESDHGSANEAAARVHYLNGGCEECDEDEVGRLKTELAKMSGRAAGQEETIAELREELASARDERTELIAERDQANVGRFRAAEELERRTASFDKEIAGAAADVERLAAERDQARHGIATYVDAAGAGLKEIQRLTDERDQAQAELAQFTVHLTDGDLPDDVDTLRRYVHYARSTARFVDAGNEQLRKDLAIARADRLARAQERGAALDTVADLRAALARAEQATNEARLTTAWWAFDDSEHDAWESNALFGDEQHALAYALDAWAKCERNRCADHDDEPASECEDCQGMAAYVARLEWRKVANRWELWDKGVEPQWKPSWSGVTVAPTKLHWPKALAADVPAAPPAPSLRMIPETFQAYTCGACERNIAVEHEVSHNAIFHAPAASEPEVTPSQSEALATTCDQLVWLGTTTSFPCGRVLNDDGSCPRHGAPVAAGGVADDNKETSR